jgi:hypothetical protein
MGDFAGEGNPRFKGPGSLWKTSWRGKVPYTEMCCFLNFDDDPAGQWYEDPGGALPLVPGAGFWIGAVIGVAAAPSGGTPVEFIARNGAVSGEGWDLIMNDGGPDPSSGNPRVSFTFAVYDGAVVTAAATTGAAEFVLDPQAGIDRVFYRILAWFLPPPDGGAFGSINIAQEGFVAGAPIPLAAAYVNTTPFLTVGKGDILGTALTAPNCLHGLVGGDGVKLGDDADMAAAALAWARQVHVEYQIVPLAPPALPAITTIAGWRGNTPYLLEGDAPDPLAPFVGAVPLVFANAVPPASLLSVSCGQPSVFAAQTI